MTTEVYRNMVWRGSPSATDETTTTETLTSFNGTAAASVNGNYNVAKSQQQREQMQQFVLERLQRQELERSLLNRGSELESNAVAVLDEFH